MAEDTDIVKTFHVEGMLCLQWDRKTGRLLSLDMINALFSEDPVASSAHHVVTSGQGCSAFQNTDSSAISRHGNVPKKHGCTSQPCFQDENGVSLFCKAASEFTTTDSPHNCNSFKEKNSSYKGIFRQLDAARGTESNCPLISSLTETMRTISYYFKDVMTKTIERYTAGSSLSQNAVFKSAENEAVVELDNGTQSISGQVKSRLSSLMDKLTRLISFENSYRQDIRDLSIASVSAPSCEDKIFCIVESVGCSYLPPTDLKQGTGTCSKENGCASMDAQYTVKQSHCATTPPTLHHDIVESVNNSMVITDSLASSSNRTTISEQVNVTCSDMPSTIQSSVDLTHVDVNSVNKTSCERPSADTNLIYSEELTSTVCPRKNKISFKRSRENIKPFKSFSSTFQKTFCDKVITESGEVLNTVLSPMLNDRKTPMLHSRCRRNGKSKKMSTVKGYGTGINMPSSSHDRELHSGHMSRQLCERVKEMPAIGLLYQGEKLALSPSRRITRQWTREMAKNFISSHIENDQSKKFCSPSALRYVKRKKNARTSDASQGRSSKRLLFPEDTNTSFPERQQKRRRICIRSRKNARTSDASQDGSSKLLLFPEDTDTSFFVRQLKRRRICSKRSRKSDQPCNKVADEKVRNSLQACGMKEEHFSRTKWGKGFRYYGNISQCPRPRNSFIFFSMKERARLVASRPRLNFGEISKLLGEMWVNMSDADKEPYRIQAQKDAKRYYMKVAKNQQTLLLQATSPRKRHSTSIRCRFCA